MTDNEIIAATVRLRECVETLERIADEWRRRALAAEARVRELESPWVPCGERLPSLYRNLDDRSPDVLVWDADTGRVRMSFYDYRSGYWDGTNHQASYTHWQPMPFAPGVLS